MVLDREFYRRELFELHFGLLLSDCSQTRQAVSRILLETIASAHAILHRRRVVLNVRWNTVIQYLTDANRRWNNFVCIK